MVPRAMGWLAAALATVTLFAACTGGPNTIAPPTGPTRSPTGGTHTPEPTPSRRSPAPAESPVPAESNPPGDIPDSTAFVPYRSKAGGFKISAPEGWARTTTSSSVTFTDKLNTIVVSWQPASTAPTVASANATDVPQLRKETRAFRLGKVGAASLPAGKAILVDYQVNSEPNKVTGKQYRLDVLRYELFHNGTEGVITLLSPVGADNVDPWRIVTQSFGWT